MNKVIDSENKNPLIDTNELRRIKLTNAISIISFISVWIFVFTYFILGDTELSKQTTLLGLMSVGTLLPVLLNQFKLHQAAKIVVSSYSTLIMLIFVIFFRADLTSGHTFFFIYGLIPVFIWSAREWPYIALFYSINLLCFIFIEFVDFEYKLASEVPTPNSEFLSGFTILLCFLTATVAVVIFHRLAHQKEVALQKLNAQIGEQKENLLLTNKKLQDKVKQLTINEDNLSQANTVKSKIFSIIAHDLRSPFSSLKNLLELVVTEYDSIEETQRRSYIESIYNTSQSTYSLLDNLLDWSRLQTNRIKVEKKSLNLNEICKNVIELNTTRIKKKDLKVISFIPNHLFVYSDKYMLSTILRNLISNAIKYTPFRGEISIKVEIANSSCDISIIDTGVGMSSYDLDQLFNMETNFTKPGTDNEKGTGLGLLICKEFIKLNGSELDIESEEGVGSKFSFSLEKSTTR